MIFRRQRTTQTVFPSVTEFTRIWTLSLLVVLLAFGSLASAAPTTAQLEFFESKVRPLLAKHCYECHRQTAEGSLRLDSREHILNGGDQGPAAVAGKPDQSLLLTAVLQTDEDLQMPPKRKLKPNEIAILKKWIADGLAWPEVTASAVRPDQLWSLAPLKKPAVPQLAAPTSAVPTHPIDAFIDAKLQQHKLQKTKIADARTLIRRVTFDLIGLPPTPKQIEQFVAATEQNATAAYSDLIERLLASHQYGERWGRHWLDLVRYADTAGDGADFPIPEAYKYRNYVIDSFNSDKPYDQFIREQIAGDLLPYESDDQRWRQTIGTGYLAISRRIGVSPYNLRHITLEDTIDNLGKTFLGLSISCARCHDHKFDPIPTTDYYALYGIFDSTVFPHAGAEHKPWRQDFVYRIGKQKSDEILKPYRDVLEVWNKKEREKLEIYRDFQRKPIDDPNLSRESTWQDVLDVREQHRQHAVTFPDLEIAYAVQEADGRDVHVQRGGDPQKKYRGELVRRGFLEILGGQTLPENYSGSGRLQLSNWIASKDNPLTARVLVNRIWHHHFGAGIVKSTSDFGVRGTPPTHPELLDYLATYLMEQEWSIKSLHRFMLHSEAYRRSSFDIPANSEIDPSNDYLWRFNRQRLDAEQIRDSLLTFAGQLDETRGDRHPMPHRLTYFFRQHEPFIGNFPSNRRSVYLFQQRIRKNEYLDLFDGPDGNLPFPERKATTTTLQALFLMNSDFIHQISQQIAQQFSNESNDVDQIRTAYTTLFGRPATEQELEYCQTFLTRQKRVTSDPNLALSGLVRSMISSNEFLFVD